MNAWHFVKDWKLRDGQPLVVGKTYEYTGELAMCRSGLHASKQLIDAVRYAPGSVLCCVEMSGEVVHADDKMVGRERKVLWALDADKLLRLFACDCAEQALERKRKAGREPDKRSWAAIQAGRDYVAGKIDKEALNKARRASSAAAYAASAAAYAVASAVASAASSAASYAASYAASAAARKKERQWQEKHLLKMVNDARKASPTGEEGGER